MILGTFDDLVGRQFGKLTVLYRAKDYVQPSGQHKRMWHCVCECGNECDIRAADLKTGNTKSCGCLQKAARGQVQFEDLTGKVFGKLTVLYRMPNHVTPSGQQQRIWHCLCECGNEKDIYASQLKNGKGSCGCSRKKGDDLIGKTYGRLTVIAFDRAVNGRDYWLCKCSCGIAQNFSVSAERLRTGKKTSCGCMLRENRKQYRKVQNVENKLTEKNPTLASEWHPTKNGDLQASLVLTSSSKKVWWLGRCGHEWEASIASRHRGNGCPYCSNQKVLSGYNDFATTHPDLLAEWDYDKNAPLKPTAITAGSSKKVWWICSLGHSYEMIIGSRTAKRKSGCPYCSIPAKKVLKGFNDLQTKFPSIASEWHSTKNGLLKPSEVLCGTEKRVWWICSVGHSYNMPICTRTGISKGNCPYCSNQRLLKGFNDFETKHPDLLNEWDYEKNSLLPSQIGVGTHKKVWWKCPFGHSYSSIPSNRVGKMHSGCPVCAKERHTSFPEQALFYYLKKAFDDVINSDTGAIGSELDIYIPSLKTAIEYDGLNWHKNTKHEMKKNSLCVNNGIKLIRIREEGLPYYDECVCFIRKDPRKGESLNSVILELLKYFKIENIDVDVNRDSSAIYSQYIINRKENSFESKYPLIAAEWNYDKNGEIKPNMVAYGSNKLVWWVCSYGHEYQMSISNRTNQNCGCPYCSGKRVLKGYNDLKTVCPQLIEEWDFAKNVDIEPDSVSAHSDRKAWWLCQKCGYSWLAKIDGRTRMQAGCPKCGQETINQSHYKPVRNIDTGQTYESIKQAGELMGINPACIGNVCRGKQKRAGKFRWEYINTTNERTR